MTHSALPITPLTLGKHITCLPVIHGSGVCALAVRRWLLEHGCDLLAVILPDSYRYSVLEGVEALPAPSLVLQRPLQFGNSWSSFKPNDDLSEDDSEAGLSPVLQPAWWSYVPVDPCQPVIAALRVALGERWDIEFCDLETDVFQPQSSVLPDAYALRKVPLERFATAILPGIKRPQQPQVIQRLQYVARRLKQLERSQRRIVIVCSILEWPWLREAFREPEDSPPLADEVQLPARYAVQSNSLLFMFGELPYITGLYERARAELEEDENLTIDGVKQLLLSARSSYLQDFGKRARRITPLMLSQCLKYIRNLTLMERRMSPDMYNMAVAAQQILGDQYTIHLIEAARSYPYDSQPDLMEITMGIDQLRTPDGERIKAHSRLPGQPLQWRSLELNKKPALQDKQRWLARWNPYGQCSWPPEDTLIESFRTRVADRAQALIGADLARSEKFSSSIKDGIDIRETLRHWYDGDIYVKVLPPSVGSLDCVVMLFDTPADPREYPWRTTWFAEHQNESTLAFFATDFGQEMVGPGIALATYGGAMFLFPPVAIADIWSDPRLQHAEDLEERLLAAACLHSRESRIALLSPKSPGARWRRIARHYRRQLVHIPLSHFNDAMVQQMRMVHVLNGKQVRSYAEHFIRKA
ncbi:MAG: hypothetical protein KF752_15120 [Pirellulaceae bacterium]|nr:hypothetical protein [Pirellulaceae bacterium]